jgi:hypothetical protein
LACRLLVDGETDVRVCGFCGFESRRVLDGVGTGESKGDVRNIYKVFSDRVVEHTWAPGPVVIEDFVGHVPGLNLSFEVGDEIRDVLSQDGH